MTLCIWKCPERCLIYVCIRCKFYYGTQGELRDFPLNTWLPWSNPISLIQTRGKDRRSERGRIGRNFTLQSTFTVGNVLYTVNSISSLPCLIVLPFHSHLVSEQNNKLTNTRTLTAYACQYASVDAIKHRLPSAQTPTASNQGFQSQ